MVPPLPPTINPALNFTNDFIAMTIPQPLVGGNFIHVFRRNTPSNTDGGELLAVSLVNEASCRGIGFVSEAGSDGAGMRILVAGSNSLGYSTNINSPQDPTFIGIRGTIYRRDDPTTNLSPTGLYNTTTGIPVQTYAEALTTRYYLYAQIATNSDWLLYVEQVAVNGPCIHPEMKIDRLNKKISEIKDIPFDNQYVKNLSLGYATKFVKIQKNAISQNVPSDDLLLTPAHPINHNGVEIPVKNLVGVIPNVSYINYETPVKVYTLAFNNRKTEKIHGIDVWQWDIIDFENFCEKQNYSYHNDELVVVRK